MILERLKGILDRNKFRLNGNLDDDSLQEVLVGAIYGMNIGAYLDDIKTGFSESEIIEFVDFKWNIHDNIGAQEKLNNLLLNKKLIKVPEILKVWDERNQVSDEYWKLHSQDESESLFAIQIYKNLKNCYNDFLRFNLISSKSELEQIGVFGWEYVRGSVLSRFCFERGFISEKELAHYLNSFFIKTIKQFESWEQLMRSYVIGNALLKGSINKTIYNNSKELLESAKSPLKLVSLK